MTIVKQIYEIDEQDLLKYEIWEYLSEDLPDAKDECSVIGVKSYDDVVSMCWVAIKCIDKNGKRYNGLAQPSGDAIYDRQATVFINGKTLTTWTGVMQPDIKKTESDLGIKLADIFPMRYRFNIAHRGINDKEVTIDGIGYIPTGKTLEEYKIACA